MNACVTLCDCSYSQRTIVRQVTSTSSYEHPCCSRPGTIMMSNGARWAIRGGFGISSICFVLLDHPLESKISRPLTSDLSTYTSDDIAHRNQPICFMPQSPFWPASPPPTHNSLGLSQAAIVPPSSARVSGLCHPTYYILPC